MLTRVCWQPNTSFRKPAGRANSAAEHMQVPPWNQVADLLLIASKGLFQNFRLVPTLFNSFVFDPAAFDWLRLSGMSRSW
jgi:hypothetical protein